MSRWNISSSFMICDSQLKSLKLPFLIQPPVFSWQPVSLFSSASDPFSLHLTENHLPLCPQHLFQPSKLSEHLQMAAQPVTWVIHGIETWSLLLTPQHSKIREFRNILSHWVCCCCGLNSNYSTGQRTGVQEDVWNLKWISLHFL